MMRIFLIVTAILSALSFLGFMLMLGIHIPSFGMWFYNWQFSSNDTYNVVNMYPEHLHEVTRHMIDYLRAREDVLQIYTMVGGQYRPFFSHIEILHMVDVRAMARVSIILRNVFALLFVASFVPFVALRFKVKRAFGYLFKAWRWASASIFALLGIFAIIISINWMRAWIVFHEIFFNNEYWLLNPYEDLLINIVPYQFFLSLSIFVGIFFGVSLILLFMAGFLFKKLLPQRGGLRLP